jgi:hypothetical protein
MDLYTGPVGQANLIQQIHDYSPGIGPKGLFWIIAVPDNSVEIDLDGGSASLRLSNVPIIDAHDLANSLTNGNGFPNPPIPPIAPVPATVSFDIEWFNVISQAKVTNEGENFTGNFVETMATISWSSHQAGFDFFSEPPNPTRNVYSVIGRERNGSFFHPD